MERHIYVARHGETDWNAVGRWQGHSDIPLNDQGREQARALGRALSTTLAGTRLSVIVASDLARAKETATIVSKVLGVTGLLLDPALRERRFGVFEGLTREECELRHGEAFRAWSADPRCVPPGAETYDAVLARIVPAARNVADRLTAPGDAALIVSHGGAIRALLRHIGGVPEAPIPNGGLFRIACYGSAFTRAEAIAR